MILLRLVAGLLRALFWPLLRLRWARAVREGAWISIDIAGPVLDITERRRFWQLRRRPSLSIHALSELVDAVLADPRVKGLVVTLKSFGAGMATATSLHNELGRLRAAGREIVVHLPLGGDTKELYVAMAATRIFVGPQATLAPLGFSTSVRYVKGALAKAGLVPEILARGDYKSAGEQLVRESMSERQREQLDAIYDVFYAELLRAIGEGRGVDRERAVAIVDGAPYRAEAALAAGLVDGTAYEDEIPALLGASGARAKILDAKSYLRLLHATRFAPILPDPVIGVIPVHGAISVEGPMPFGAATDEKLIAAIRSARKNSRVRAVILHIDSPGGSALASDRIHHELVQLAAEKPLVACFANVAASGGYYVAAAAHAIVAQPTTITGSIGVVAARVVLGPLLERLGVVTETVKRGARADMLDPTRAFTDDERVALERELDGMYRAFVGIVAAGRKLSIEAVEKVAEGRVWTGSDAATRDLVDELGGFDVALARARKLVGSAKAQRLRPVVLRAPRHAGAPLVPPAKAAAQVLARLFEVDVFALASTRERVLAWSSLASTLR